MTTSSFQAITLEDPIEKNLNNIIQVQVNERAGITYDTGLKAALRHDQIF
nr:ATPase, T2SS/T4P/T4SS family [Halobacillus karajensis]